MVARCAGGASSPFAGPRRRLLDWLGSAASTPELQTAADRRAGHQLPHPRSGHDQRPCPAPPRPTARRGDRPGPRLRASGHDPELQEVGGRGPGIVEAEASRWGIHEGTTHVLVRARADGSSARRRQEAGGLTGRDSCYRSSPPKRLAVSCRAPPALLARGAAVADADGLLPGRRPKLCVFSPGEVRRGRTATIRAALARIARIAACPRARFGRSRTAANAGGDVSADVALSHFEG
jgi:hypothetical protein